MKIEIWPVSFNPDDRLLPPIEAEPRYCFFCHELKNDPHNSRCPVEHDEETEHYVYEHSLRDFDLLEDQ